MDDNHSYGFQLYTVQLKLKLLVCKWKKTQECLTAYSIVNIFKDSCTSTQVFSLIQPTGGVFEVTKL